MTIMNDSERGGWREREELKYYILWPVEGTVECCSGACAITGTSPRPSLRAGRVAAVGRAGCGASTPPLVARPPIRVMTNLLLPGGEARSGWLLFSAFLGAGFWSTGR